MAKKQTDFSELFEELGAIEDMLNDRIVEYHKVNGMQGERHAMSYYRSKIWNCIEILRKLTN